MGLLDGALAAVFGAALTAALRDGVLHKTTETATGTGGFGTTATDYPVKLCLDALGFADRAAGGLPASAVRLTVLQAGLPVSVDLDDGVSVGGATYRIVRRDTDPAGAAVILAAVPA